MSARPRFYNPREASPEVLEAMLVGRQAVVEEILADLARQAGSATRQHWLIRGPRGIGKTHLIGIVYHRAKSTPLSRTYLPIWLGESEAYSVYSAAVLLLQVAHQLVVELRQSGDPGHAAVRSRIGELEHAGDDPVLFEEIVQLLRDEARSRGRILLVLMENLDAALAGLPGKRGTGQVQRLRSLLSEDKELLFLSTTPTRLPAFLDPRKPLFGQLKERTLLPLTEEEVGQLLARLAEVTGEPTKAGFEGPEPEFRVRRRVLHRLTGGNPRAVVMAFSVLTGSPGVQAIVEEMSALLDAQTAYFEARLAQLAPRERSVVAAMASAPENLTLKEIGQRSRLPLRSLSTQMKRLQEQGYVVPADGQGGKGTLYEVSDGLFRLWYQFRKGERILAPIVQFLALWHPLEELERTLDKLRSADEERPLLQHDLIRLTLRQLGAAVELARSSGRQLRDDLWRQCRADIEIPLSLKDMPEATPKNVEKPQEVPEFPGKSSGFDGEADLRFSSLWKMLVLAVECDFQELEAGSEELLRQCRRTADVPEGIYQHALLLRSAVALDNGDDANGGPLLVEWATHVAKNNAHGEMLKDILLGLAVNPAVSRAALAQLAKSEDLAVAEQARLFRFLAKAVEAELNAKPGQSRRALARVPPELRQMVSELADQVMAARRKGLIPKRKAPPPEGV